MQPSRRQLLFSAAALSLVGPALARLEGRAHAATGAVRRLLVIHTPNGTIHHQRRPSGGETDFTFPAGSILEPLAPWRDQLVVVDGLDFRNASNHEGGMRAMLTGNGGAGDPGGGRSIDQLIAASLAAPTPFASLELGVQTSAWGSGTQTRMSYAGPDRRVDPDDDPFRVRERLFGTLGDLEARERLRTRRQQVAEVVGVDLDRLHAVLPSAEADKIAQHASALADLTDRRISTEGCATPDLGDPVDLRDHAVFGRIARQQTDLIAAAFACDLTRVASLQMGHTVSPHVLSEAGVSDGHHTLSHSGDGDAAGVDAFRRAERWLTERVADVVSTLATTEDPVTGGVLLDSTLVLWAKEMGDSRAHVCEDVPMVLIGGLGGALPTGRYLRYDGDSHEELLISVAQLMGLSVTGFGAHGRRALPGLV